MVSLEPDSSLNAYRRIEATVKKKEFIVVSLYDSHPSQIILWQIFFGRFSH